jgi:hypothetical protein
VDQVFAPQKTNLPRQTLRFCKIQAEEFKHSVAILKLIASATIFPWGGSGRSGQASIRGNKHHATLGKPLAAFCIAASLAVIHSGRRPRRLGIVGTAGSTPRVAHQRGQQGGKATALYGVWIKARKSLTTKGPAPTVIALHGCGGLYSMVKDGKGEFTPRHLAMARVLSDAGYNVLFPDSFTPRGRRSTCQDTVAQREISAMNRRFDVQAALHWVTSQPDVDVKRIALLGWSHGASTLLAAINLAETDVAVRKIQPRCRGLLSGLPSLCQDHRALQTGRTALDPDGRER